MGAHFMDLTSFLLIELLVILNLILLILVLSLTLGIRLAVLKDHLLILALSVLVSLTPLLVHLTVLFLHNRKLGHLLLLLMPMISSPHVHLPCVSQTLLIKILVRFLPLLMGVEDLICLLKIMVLVRLLKIV